ncbi:MAG: tetratricopeptide repeat protein [Candidatus Dormibacteraeota bacterium]|nr:tetratricopeptide repeat protein [Candidatus Dormibacteraeota bacterium]
MGIDPRIALLASVSDPGGDIAEGALWLAAEDCPEVEVEASLRIIDGLGDELGECLGGARGAAAVTVIHDLLRDRLHLRRSGGGDPRAHYLHTVLGRGAGIPISCAVVWMAVGRRAGLEVEGVGLPGHFGVRVDGVLAEPSNGDVLDDEAALRLVAHATGQDPPSLQPSWLQPATSRVILARMSRNLRGCYASLERWDLAVRAADRCVALFPDEMTERRDRGLLLFRAGHNSAALADLRQYLDRAPPEVADRGTVEEVAGRIRASLN